MAQHHQLDERNLENVIVSQDVFCVYEGTRAINELVSKLQEAMHNLNMEMEIYSHMQQKLFEFPIGPKKKEI